MIKRTTAVVDQNEPWLNKAVERNGRWMDEIVDKQKELLKFKENEKFFHHLALSRANIF